MNTFGNLLTDWPQDHEWPLVEQMDLEHFPRPWKIGQWRSLAGPHHYLYRWNQNNKLSGFALFAHLKGDETAHLLKICLAPDCRGKGIALAFWSQIQNNLKTHGVSKVFLEVEETNLRAQGFYEKVGFSALRAMKGYYSDGENAVAMLLAL